MFCSSCGWVDRIIDSTIQVLGTRLQVHYIFYQASDDNHHTSIIKLSVLWYVWKVKEGFPDRVCPKTLKWVVVYSSVTFHMAFLCGSTLVKAQLLQAGTFVIWSPMFKVTLNPNKQTNRNMLVLLEGGGRGTCFSGMWPLTWAWWPVRKLFRTPVGRKWFLLDVRGNSPFSSGLEEREKSRLSLSTRSKKKIINQFK